MNSTELQRGVKLVTLTAILSSLNTSSSLRNRSQPSSILQNQRVPKDSQRNMKNSPKHTPKPKPLHSALHIRRCHLLGNKKRSLDLTGFLPDRQFSALSTIQGKQRSLPNSMFSNERLQCIAIDVEKQQRKCMFTPRSRKPLKTSLLNRILTIKSIPMYDLRTPAEFSQRVFSCQVNSNLTILNNKEIYNISKGKSAYMNSKNPCKLR